MPGFSSQKTDTSLLYSYSTQENSMVMMSMTNIISYIYSNANESYYSLKITNLLLFLTPMASQILGLFVISLTVTLNLGLFLWKFWLFLCPVSDTWGYAVPWKKNIQIIPFKSLRREKEFFLPQFLPISSCAAHYEKYLLPKTTLSNIYEKIWC